jgi:hypothetical protein
MDFMLSNQINRYGLTFSNWFSLEDAVRQAPNSPGVYAMRSQGQVLNRVNGESDIAYFGSSYDLKTRLGQHSRRSAQNRIRRFSDLYPIEIAFAKIPTANPISTPETFYEAMLLNDYWGDHHEFPPINHSAVMKHFLGTVIPHFKK